MCSFCKVILSIAVLVFNLSYVQAQGFRVKEIHIDQTTGADFTSFEHYTYEYASGRSGNYLSQLFPFAPGSIDFDECIYEIYLGEFIPAAKTLKQFNADTNVTEATTLLWTGTDYINFTQETFEYIGTDLAIKYKNTWDGISWTPVLKNEYVHAGGLLTQKTEYSYDGGLWENSEQYTYTYDGEVRLASVDIKKWFGGGWTDKELYTFVYDDISGLPTEVTHQMNFGAGLENNARSLFYYSAGWLTEKTDQSYDGAGWVNSKQYLPTFDIDQNLTQFYLNTWDGAVWADSLHYTFTYEYFTGINTGNEKDVCLIYPNPAGDVLNISLSNTGEFEITVFDIAGRAIQYHGISQKTDLMQLDVTALPKGFYIVMLQDVAGVNTIPFMKE